MFPVTSVKLSYSQSAQGQGMSYRKTGFIGLGEMGYGMAMNLLKKHSQLAVFDIDPSRTKTLGQQGAEVFETAENLAQACDLLFLCLPSSSVVDSLLFADDGILARKDAPLDLTIIDTTTLPSSDALNFAKRCAEKAVPYYDAPVSGLPKRAKDGSLTIMFGGTENVFADIRPYLEMMGNDCIYCGATGTGQAMKSVNNIIYNINIAALCEVIPLALKNGLNEEAVAQVVTGASSRSFASEHFVPKIRQRVFDGDFPMQGAYKDIDNFRTLIEKAEAESKHLQPGDFPVSEAMIKVYEKALKAGYGQDPKSSMIKLYEKMLGVEFR